LTRFPPKKVNQILNANRPLIRLFHEGENGAHKFLLFHLRDDIGEKPTSPQKIPKKTAALDAKIGRFLDRTKTLVSVPNPNFVRLK
jgi:hypothetical protein